MGIEFPLTPQSVRLLLNSRDFSSQFSLSSDQIKEICASGAIVGSTINRFAHLDRGMNTARQLIDEYEKKDKSFPSGMVIMADSMAKSQGRFDRDWFAPVGGIWLALVMVNTLLPQISRLYPLAAGIACCEFIRHYNIDARLKWVNDVLVRGKKTAGILTETCFGRKSKEEYIIIGLGINVNNHSFPAELQDEAVSMRTELGEKIDLNKAILDLLACLAWNMGLLCFDEKTFLADFEENDRSKLLIPARWRQLSDCPGRKVKFGFNVRENPQYEARVTGLDESGGLQLLLADGSRITEYGGEIIYLD